MALNPLFSLRKLKKLQSLSAIRCAAGSSTLQAVEHTRGSWLLLCDESPQFSLQENGAINQFH